MELEDKTQTGRPFWSKIKQD